MLETDFDVVGIVRDGESALQAARELDPDVLVLDISMQGMNGIEVARRQKEAGGSKTSIVFLTVHEDPDYVHAALEAGALGYVIKPRLASDLVVAIREAHAGRSFISKSVSPDNSS